MQKIFFRTYFCNFFKDFESRVGSFYFNLSFVLLGRNSRNPATVTLKLQKEVEVRDLIFNGIIVKPIIVFFLLSQTFSKADSDQAGDFEPPNIKVIIYKSRGELSLLMQPTIQCVVQPILTQKSTLQRKNVQFSYFYVYQLFSVDVKIYTNSNLYLFCS